MLQVPTKLVEMLFIQTPLAKRRRIPLTPLIDVIFILIMFFLLSSTFGVWRPLDVGIGSSTAEKTNDQLINTGAPSVLIQIGQGASAEGMTIVVNGSSLELVELSAELNRLAGLGAESAILLPAKGTEFQSVIEILDEARTSKLKRISLKLN